MAGYRNFKWETAEVYHPESIESILINLKIDPTWETETNFLALCPFHDNTDTPAFSIEKETGLFMCFAPHCGAKGNLQQLVERAGGFTVWEAKRFIEKYKHEIDLEAIVARNIEKPVEFVKFDQGVLDELKSNFVGSEAEEYMFRRGFSSKTLDYFDIGYSINRKMVVVPMHDPNGMPIGLIGRSIEGKRFKNSVNLPKSKTAWNFHRAKHESDTVIICESSFDAMRIHQAGFPNVIALLGGYISTEHARQIGRSFSTIINFTDADQAGRKLAESIYEKLIDKRILWAADCPEWHYPFGKKDASDLTDDQIRKLVVNAISTTEYRMWYD